MCLKCFCFCIYFCSSGFECHVSMLVRNRESSEYLYLKINGGDLIIQKPVLFQGRADRWLRFNHQNKSSKLEALMLSGY